jgi:hypothetical protein
MTPPTPRLHAARRAATVLSMLIATLGCSNVDDGKDSGAAVDDITSDAVGVDAAATDAAATDAAATDAVATDAVATDTGNGDTVAVDDTDAVAASDAVTAVDQDSADTTSDIAGDADIDASDDVGIDAGPAKLCPVTNKPPAANEDWGAPVKADTSGCSKIAPAFFKGEPPPPESLKIEIGVVDESGTFVPYAQDGWVPMTHGAQGGFHVFVAIRYTFAGATEPKQKVQIEGQLYDSCELTGYGLAPVVYPANVGGNVYVFGEVGAPGMIVIFNKPGTVTGQKSSASVDFCNRYFDLRVSAREFKSGKWGSNMVRIRTYDTPHDNAAGSTP